MNVSRAQQIQDQYITITKEKHCRTIFRTEKKKVVVSFDLKDWQYKVVCEKYFLQIGCADEVLNWLINNGLVEIDGTCNATIDIDKGEIL